LDKLSFTGPAGGHTTLLIVVLEKNEKKKSDSGAIFTWNAPNKKNMDKKRQIKKVFESVCVFVICYLPFNTLTIQPHRTT
jgi:hypothetical protein